MAYASSLYAQQASNEYVSQVQGIPERTAEIFDRLESIAHLMEGLGQRADQLDDRLFGDRPPTTAGPGSPIETGIIQRAHSQISAIEAYHQRLNSFLNKLESILPSTSIKPR